MWETVFVNCVGRHECYYKFVVSVTYIEYPVRQTVTKNNNNIYRY